MPSELNPTVDCFVFQDGKLAPCLREIVTEEPLRIMLGDDPLVTLVRTPGNEEELALGFLLTAGVISSADEVRAIEFRSSNSANRGEVRVHLFSDRSLSRQMARPRGVFSSGGIDHADSIEELMRDVPAFSRLAGRLTPDDIFTLGEAMRRAQERFRRTGGTHAAALASPPMSADSKVVVREDIGRHNALDKAVGAAAREKMLSGNALLFTSGRLSLEMVSKAARAGIGDLAGVSAPSAAAVELAGRLHMFLAGFVRDGRMTVYSGRDALKV